MWSKFASKEGDCQWGAAGGVGIPHGGSDAAVSIAHPAYPADLYAQCRSAGSGGNGV
jgi:hypothetical protein